MSTHVSRNLNIPVEVNNSYEIDYPIVMDIADDLATGDVRLDFFSMKSNDWFSIPLSSEVREQLYYELRKTYGQTSTI